MESYESSRYDFFFRTLQSKPGPTSVSFRKVTSHLFPLDLTRFFRNITSLTDNKLSQWDAGWSRKSIITWDHLSLCQRRRDAAGSNVGLSAAARRICITLTVLMVDGYIFCLQAYILSFLLGINSVEYLILKEKKKDIQYICFTLSLRGPHPGARPGVGARRRAPAGGPRDPAGLSPKWRHVGPPSSRLTTRRKVQGGQGLGSHEGPVQCGLGSSRGRGPRRPNPWNKTLAIGTWNVTSLGELLCRKEPELVQEGG
ncbi:hypothetical protein L3Q82_005979 [Scortum barcoo]|uniref:Uncharacterized protein n=1 Tax=Scortum barcoo TaxID=214431 RepID=A0ACB8X3G1_9TELE|nr:hypothetical protein L3Q82_005979 [Scortum barcoo]